VTNHSGEKERVSQGRKKGGSEKEPKGGREIY